MPQDVQRIIILLIRLASQCKKGDDIGTFLEKCRQQVPELRGVSVDNLMYIKEDLIVPHVRAFIASKCLTSRQLTPLDLQHYTFYDFIVNKARGKSGPLFNFDVHDDVRLVADATIEKDEVSSSIFAPYFRCSCGDGAICRATLAK